MLVETETLLGSEAVGGPVCAIVSRCRLEDQRQPALRYVKGLGKLMTLSSGLSCSSVPLIERSTIS